MKYFEQLQQLAAHEMMQKQASPGRAIAPFLKRLMGRKPALKTPAAPAAARPSFAQRNWKPIAGAGLAGGLTAGAYGGWKANEAYRDYQYKKNMQDQGRQFLNNSGRILLEEAAKGINPGKRVEDAVREGGANAADRIIQDGANRLLQQLPR